MKREKIISNLKIHLFFLAILFFTVEAAAQKETIIWAVQDADPYINLAFSHDGSTLALGRQDGNVSEFRNAADGTFISSFNGRFNSTNDLVFTLDDQYLINGTGGGGSTRTLNMWQVSSGARIVGPLGDHTNGTTSISLSADGQYVATSGRFDREINLWFVPGLTLLRTIVNEDEQSPGLPPRVKDVAFSPDGQFIASSDIYSIKLRRTIDGTLALRIPSAEAPSIAFSPSGAYIAAAVESERAVKLWRVSDGALVRTLTIDTDFSFPVIAFSPNGKVIAAGYNGAIKFWRVLDGRPLALIPKPALVHSLVFAPKGNRYAYSLYGGTVSVAYAPFVF
jgi:WD40 repeat protein